MTEGSRATDKHIVIQTEEATVVAERNVGLQGDPGIPAPAGLCLGPWVDTRVLGFLNSSGKTVRLDDESTNGTGTINWRQKNGSTVSAFPVDIEDGDLFEVSVSAVSGRFYLAYSAQEA
jgi:hypothetical protein